jgi:predicted SprT family Zn-dependent metalloprotease
MKLLLLIFFLVLYVVNTNAQSSNKELPAGYEKQVIFALAYFPELRDVAIQFLIKHTHTPLSTRPTFWSIFKKPAKRKYIITISDESVVKLSPILFNNLNDSAQIGVIGHELSHVTDFQKMKFFGFMHLLIKHYSNKYQDRFEYNTDKICIEHGMGHYLLAWSVFVRNALHVKNWRGADNIEEKPTDCERYMNPQTIRSFLDKAPSK